jgi:hypothetical protein
MDQPTDPLSRQQALSALTTEQFNLQTARMGTIAEANGRSTLYLGTLSSAVIAIAFVGQASQLGNAFYLFALLLLPPVFLLGLFSYLRLVQTSIEDLVYAAGSFRIRQYFLGLDPAAVPFFPPTDPQGMTKLERMGVVATGPLQLSRTARRPGRSPDMTARPNIVLVHGAWADGASWSAVMPTVVAGHSYGGQIITTLGTDAPNAVGMVYIAGFGLDEGESIGALLDQAPAGPALAHLDVDPVKAVEGSA